jgi:hypothetical protein
MFSVQIEVHLVEPNIAQRISAEIMLGHCKFSPDRSDLFAAGALANDVRYAVRHVSWVQRRFRRLAAAAASTWCP